MYQFLGEQVPCTPYVRTFSSKNVSNYALSPMEVLCTPYVRTSSSKNVSNYAIRTCVCPFQKMSQTKPIKLRHTCVIFKFQICITFNTRPTYSYVAFLHNPGLNGNPQKGNSWELKGNYQIITITLVSRVIPKRVIPRNYLVITR